MAMRVFCIWACCTTDPLDLKLLWFNDYNLFSERIDLISGL